ncbi:hypothetical protein GMLC_16950 [Geomonas limicola]|uniref:DUF1634 domain-containing protein n=1 Tax=Geomonas limicola TaxID=2740186 RepID=A0A6V8N6D0_9BACT|nr:DUF1634 domain-containing protein [Geomonas limicola]GFO68116.1 hypothetical protein GMLC_16950 [Geomonas limicola]
MVVNENSVETRHDAIELVLARLLRLGSLVAAALLAVGLAAMVAGLSVIAPKLITAGLLVLLGTPILRVVTAAVIFIRERDWYFAFFCAVVLVALATGIVLGRVG